MTPRRSLLTPGLVLFFLIACVVAIMALMIAQERPANPTPTVAGSVTTPAPTQIPLQLPQLQIDSGDMLYWLAWAGFAVALLVVAYLSLQLGAKLGTSLGRRRVRRQALEAARRQGIYSNSGIGVVVDGSLLLRSLDFGREPWVLAANVIFGLLVRATVVDNMLLILVVVAALNIAIAAIRVQSGWKLNSFTYQP
jgi:hypothetical protein